jgi:DNA-directed RNA polymerase alpha subunit
MRERMIVEMRYGLGENGWRYTLEELSRKFCVTQTCIAQIERRAVGKLNDVASQEEAIAAATTTNDKLALPVSSLPLPRLGPLAFRIRRCLANGGVRTLGDLASKSPQEIKLISQIGDKSTLAIAEGLRSIGLDLQPLPTYVRPDLANLTDAERLLLPVDSLFLSVRPRKAMQRLGIKTIGDLLRHTEADLMSCRNFGKASLDKIKMALAIVSKRMSLPRDEAPR